MRAAEMVPPAVRTSTPARRLDAARVRSLENARAAAGGRREKSVARAHRVHLRVARCRDRGLRSDAGHAIERRGRQPAPRQPGGFPRVELFSKRLHFVRIEREVHRVALAEIGVRVSSARDRFREIARRARRAISRSRAPPRARNARARSVKSRSGSCISSAVLATGAAACRRCFDSRSATRTPASANRYAQIAPVMPPPTMTTSVSRCRDGGDISALAPAWSSQSGRPCRRRRTVEVLRLRSFFVLRLLTSVHHSPDFALHAFGDVQRAVGADVGAVRPRGGQIGALQRLHAFEAVGEHFVRRRRSFPSRPAGKGCCSPPSETARDSTNRATS